MSEIGETFSRYDELAARDDERMASANRDDGRDHKAELIADSVNRLMCKVAGLDDSPLAHKQVAIKTQIELATAHVRKRAEFLGITDQRFIGSRLDHAEQRVMHVLGLCESPIEKTVLPWLVLEDFGPRFDEFPAQVFNGKRDKFLPPGGIIIAPQFAFVRYRLDFAVIAKLNGNTKIVAVECDGAEYHNGGNDRDRDLFLRGFGVETVRASGAEIYARPRNLTHRASAIIQEWAEQQ